MTNKPKMNRNVKKWMNTHTVCELEDKLENMKPNNVKRVYEILNDIYEIGFEIEMPYIDSMEMEEVTA